MTRHPVSVRGRKTTTTGRDRDGGWPVRTENRAGKSAPIDGANIEFLARRLAEVEAHMLHVERPDLHGHAWRAEALRRALADQRCLLISAAEHERLVEQAIATWKFNADMVNRKNEFLETENRQLRAANVTAFKREVAQYIRDISNSIPGKYRWEGALIIADKLDPTHQQQGAS